MKKVKCMEYYFDSSKYNEFDVLENMERKKSEFPKKKMDMTVTLNKYGTYVVKLQFIYNEIAIIKHNVKKHKEANFRVKKEKVRAKNSDKVKVYGKYKETKNYSPI